jgi:hypothetical protein
MCLMKMAVIRRSRNEKLTDQRWGGNWRPSTAQVGGALAGIGGLGALGYLASKYPRTTTRLLQKGLGGAIRMAPALSTGADIGSTVGKGLLSSILPFGFSL